MSNEEEAIAAHERARNAFRTLINLGVFDNELHTGIDSLYDIYDLNHNLGALIEREINNKMSENPMLWAKHKEDGVAQQAMENRFNRAKALNR